MDISLKRSEMFARLELSALNYRKLVAPEGGQITELGGGTTVASDSDGTLIYAQYASGVRVRRNPSSVAVQSGDGVFWYGDCQGQWYRLD